MEDATKWGDIFYSQGNYHIITVELPTNVANQFYRWELLDGIGPARFAYIEQLQNIDLIIQGV